MKSRPKATNDIKISVPTYSQIGDRHHKIFWLLTLRTTNSFYSDYFFYQGGKLGYVVPIIKIKTHFISDIY